MLAKLRLRLTFANVTSLLALFVALGGSSYAAIKVTGKNVKDSSLTGKDIKNSSLAGGDVKDSSLGLRDFKRSELPTGPQGPGGLTGPQGPAGPAGSALAFAQVTEEGTLVPGSSKNVNSSVPAGTSVYCLDLAVPVSNAQATVDVADSNDEYAQVAIPGTGCSAPNNDARVVTFGSDGVNDRAGFFISFN